MKTLVVYDSFFGNTEQIARSIGRAFGPAEDGGVVRVGDVKPEQLLGLDLLIVGSPTRAFRPSPAITKLLKGIAGNGLEGARVAAFDTRVTEEEIASGPWILRKMVKIFGYAAKPIADRLVKRGGKLIATPEGFYVEGTEGPLKKGELERAEEWAKEIRAEEPRVQQVARPTKLTDLEKDVLVEFFLSWQIATEDRINSLDEVEVLDREVAGSGVFIDLGRHECLRVGPANMNYKENGTAAYITNDRIQVGFLFFIEEGHITCFEGYAFSEEPWPDKIECYDIGGRKGESCDE